MGYFIHIILLLYHLLLRNYNIDVIHAKVHSDKRQAYSGEYTENNPTFGKFKYQHFNLYKTIIRLQCIKI